MIPMHAHQDALRAFLERGLRMSIGAASFIGWARPDGIIAAVAYHNFHPDAGTIELSAFSARRDWLSKDRLREVFGYPFGQLGVRLCVARTSEHNHRVRRIWRALGSAEHVIPDLRADGEAEAILILRRADWLSGKFAR